MGSFADLMMIMNNVPSIFSKSVCT